MTKCEECKHMEVMFDEEPCIECKWLSLTTDNFEPKQPVIIYGAEKSDNSRELRPNPKQQQEHLDVDEISGELVEIKRATRLIQEELDR